MSSRRKQNLLGAIVRVKDPNGAGYAIGQVVEVALSDLGVRVDEKVAHMKPSKVNLIQLADLSNIYLPNWNSVMGFKNPVCPERIIYIPKVIGPPEIKIIWRSIYSGRAVRSSH